MRALAQRYAAAIADVALERNAAEQTRKEVREFTELFSASVELRNFLSNPAVARESKHAVIEKLVERLGASVMLRNFLFVLVDNRRVRLLPQIREALETHLNERLSLVDAQVTSAWELTAEQKSELAAALERLTGKRVKAHYDQDPDLLAGLVVRIGSTIYDGSVRFHLDRIRTSLAAE